MTSPSPLAATDTLFYGRPGAALDQDTAARMTAQALAGIERALSEIREVLRSLTPAEQLAGYDEAIMLAPNGLIAECTGENIFCVRKGLILTPPLSAGSSLTNWSPSAAGMTPDCPGLRSTPANRGDTA